MLPSPDILNDFPHGKYVLSNLAAKRAKQLREGAPPLVSIESNHPLTIALAEIAAGKIKPVLSAALEPSELGEVTHAIVTEETLPAELGMLLPALDETEVALVSSPAVLGEEDHVEEAEHEHEGEIGAGPAPVSLADLVGEEEEEEPAPAIAEDETLSLSDIAEQETEEEEPEE